MPKYVYLVSGGRQSMWVKDEHFECLEPTDCPQTYSPQTSLTKARDELLEKTLKGVVGLVIYKFDSKPPYKYHGKVQ